MKTPRQIYLEKHSSGEPRLDQIRRAVLEQECSPAAPRLTAISWLLEFWREGLSPCRHLLTKLAPAWAVILLLNWTAPNPGPGATGALPSGEVAWLLREQRQSMALLDDFFAAGPGEAPPKPRSERPRTVAAA